MELDNQNQIENNTVSQKYYGKLSEEEKMKYEEDLYEVFNKDKKIWIISSS